MQVRSPKSRRQHGTVAAAFTSGIPASLSANNPPCPTPAPCRQFLQTEKKGPSHLADWRIVVIALGPKANHVVQWQLARLVPPSELQPGVSCEGHGGEVGGQAGRQAVGQHTRLVQAARSRCLGAELVALALSFSCLQLGCHCPVTAPHPPAQPPVHLHAMKTQPNPTQPSKLTRGSWQSPAPHWARRSLGRGSRSWGWGRWR